MSDGDFVERLDKLSNLKKEGIINEAEYEAQVNQIKKQYLNNITSQYNLVWVDIFHLYTHKFDNNLLKLVNFLGL